MPAHLLFQVGNWSTCSGDADYGHSSRSIACVDSAGTSAASGASACPAAAPSSTAVCLRTTQSAVCRPGFIAETDYMGKDCYAHGTCTMLGCSCSSGWHGQFCEIPPDCTGVMSKANKCCPSGVLDGTGACCPAGSVLDGQGQCCQSGIVDACGVCGGIGWSVDIMVSSHCMPWFGQVTLQPQLHEILAVSARTGVPAPIFWCPLGSGIGPSQP